MSEKNLKIIGLEIENFKRLKAVSIIPKGNMIEITGKNGQGKSSLIDAIWTAFKFADTDIVKPIKDGCEKAVIRIDVDEFIVTKKFTASGNTLTVESKVSQRTKRHPLESYRPKIGTGKD